MGVDQVPFDLLQYEEQDHEDQGVHGRLDQHEKGTDQKPDKGAEYGDQGRKGDQNTDQDSIGKPDQTQDRKEHESKDTGFQALPRYEPGELFLRKHRNVAKAQEGSLRKKGFGGTLRLTFQLFLTRQKVDGKEQSDTKIRYGSRNAGDGDHGTGKDVLDPQGKVFLGPLVDAVPVDLDGL